MDYGPFLTASIEAPAPGTNIAYKGIAINLGAHFGGAHNESVIFDTDLLRYSAGWTGAFVELKGVVFDGEHWAYPRIAGRQVFGNPSGPGWSRAGSFKDPRGYPYGPLPHTWGHWKGLYLHEQKVVLSYSVGEMSVLEMPALERRGGTTAFVRTLNVSPSSTETAVQVCFDPMRQCEFLGLDGLQPVAAESAASRGLVILSSRGRHADLPARTTPTDVSDASQIAPEDVLAAAVVGGPDGARWLMTDDGQLSLCFPRITKPTRCKILIWSGPRDAQANFAALLRSSPPPADLEPYTHGGPPRWREKLVTHGTLGTNDGPYALDTLTDPASNPWRSWMRFGGLDFFPDGERVALTTWNGDVWIVSGVDGDLRDLTWQRIATGLFQPLGLRIVEDQIYVLGRDQITRLHDLNGDGESDFYENFNNDCMVSEHFHEFALDLKTGPDGSFYYIKCACHGTTAKHPHNGTLIKVSKDGSTFEVVARGFRANNGLGVGPHGELTSMDNQGHWMPANRINWIKPGGWYGYQWAWNPEGRTSYDEPLCWVHNSVDRSGGTQLWVPTAEWGPFPNEIITISYGMGHLFLLLKEEVDGMMQGAVTRFPLEFETGAMRGAWHPQTGQLYTCGLFGWAGNKTKAGGFYRVRYTGKPVHMARTLHFVRDGIVLRFTDPLAAESATDPGNYHVTAWNYHWTAEYRFSGLQTQWRGRARYLVGRISHAVGGSHDRLSESARRSAGHAGSRDLQPRVFRLSPSGEFRPWHHSQTQCEIGPGLAWSWRYRPRQANSAGARPDGVGIDSSLQPGRRRRGAGHAPFPSCGALRSGRLASNSIPGCRSIPVSVGGLSEIGTQRRSHICRGRSWTRSSADQRRTCPAGTRPRIGPGTRRAGGVARRTEPVRIGI